MKLIHLFRKLSYGELSNLSISGSGSGEIIEAKRPQLVGYVNDGLLALYSRFQLSTKLLVIEQVENITNYVISKKYAESSESDVTHKYIKDMGDPYEGDLIRILEAWDNATGCQIKLNDSGDCDSLFTPFPNILQVPVPIEGRSVTLVYQANHSKLDDRPEGILDQEIDLPVYLETALRLYVAHKVFSHMNGQENTLKGAEYEAGYEAQCLEIEKKDLVNETYSVSHTKLEKRGFV